MNEQMNEQTTEQMTGQLTEQERKQAEKDKKTLKTIFAVICIIVIAGWMDKVHYKYEHSGYNMSFTDYLTGFYWTREPESYELNPDSAFYIGF